MNALPEVRRSPNLARTLELDELAERVAADEGWVELERVDKTTCSSTRLRHRYQGLFQRGFDLAVRTIDGERILWARSAR